MRVLIARQAIFDRDRKLHGYELLYRPNGAATAFDGTAADAATMQVLSTTLMSIGAENVFGRKKAFVNFDHRLLRDNMHLTLPKDSIVIEILETVEPTADLVALCRAIADQGYSIALDDFTDDASLEPLTHIARIIKVDLRATSQDDQERMLCVYKPRGILMLAEKVETYAEFEWARRIGYDLFQGYFFARPVVVRSRQIPAVKVACLRLLKEIQQPELNLKRVEQLLREDVALTYKLLRYVNSALFAHRSEIQSIARALTVLGEEGICRWVALATLPTLATDKPSEVLTLSLVRARFCERLAEFALEPSPGRAFLMGMFSLLDALVDQPLDEALRTVDLGREVTEAILGTAGQGSYFGSLYQMVLHYEQGQWDAVEQLANLCRIEFRSAGDAYLEATEWAAQVLNLTAAECAPAR